MRKSSVLVPIVLLGLLAPFGDAGSTPPQVCYPPMLRPACDSGNPSCARYVRTVAEACANHGAAGFGQVCDGVTQDNPATGEYAYQLVFSDGSRGIFNPGLYCRTGGEF